MLVRLIGQYVDVRRDPVALERSRRRDARRVRRLGALLLQAELADASLFVGYGDNRTLQETGDLTRADRQFFLKLSYAFQR